MDIKGAITWGDASRKVAKFTLTEIIDKESRGEFILKKDGENEILWDVLVSRLLSSSYRRSGGPHLVKKEEIPPEEGEQPEISLGYASYSDLVHLNESYLVDPWTISFSSIPPEEEDSTEIEDPEFIWA